MLALKLRAPEFAEEALYDEYWIGDVETCGDAWAFAVVGPGEEIETLVFSSQDAAECARTRMFCTLGPAVAVTIGQR